LSFKGRRVSELWGGEGVKHCPVALIWAGPYSSLNCRKSHDYHLQSKTEKNTTVIF